MDEKTDYTVERTTRPRGEEVWVATDPSISGPYGMGEDRASAIADLEKGLALWGRQRPTRHLSVSDGGSLVTIISEEVEVTGWEAEDRVQFA